MNRFYRVLVDAIYPSTDLREDYIVIAADHENAAYEASLAAAERHPPSVAETRVIQGSIAEIIPDRPRLVAVAEVA